MEQADDSDEYGSDAENLHDESYHRESKEEVPEMKVKQTVVNV